MSQHKRHEILPPKSSHQEMLESVNDAFFREQIKQLKCSKKVAVTGCAFLILWGIAALVGLTIIVLVLYCLFQTAISF